MLVFLDANIVIYLIEQPPDLGSRAAGHVRSLLTAGHSLAASHLVRMECRVRPLAIGAQEVLREYDGFFASSHMTLLDVTTAVCDRAASIRAKRGFGALDALHLAAAIESGCEAFLTNDTGLTGFPGIDVTLLP